MHVVQGCSCCQCSLPQFLLFEQSFCFRIMDYLLGVWNGSSHEPQPKRQAGGDFLDTGIPSSWQSFFSQDLSELNQAELQRVSRQAAGFEKSYGKSMVSQLWEYYGKAKPSFDKRRAELIYSGYELPVLVPVPDDGQRFAVAIPAEATCVSGGPAPAVRADSFDRPGTCRQHEFFHADPFGIGRDAYVVPAGWRA